MNRCPVCDVIEGPISQICALTRCPRAMVDETEPRGGRGLNHGRPTHAMQDAQLPQAEREQRVAARAAKRRDVVRERSARRSGQVST